VLALLDLSAAGNTCSTPIHLRRLLTLDNSHAHRARHGWVAQHALRLVLALLDLSAAGDETYQKQTNLRRALTLARGVKG